MKIRKLFALSLMVVMAAFSSWASANPVPPHDASMPLEDMYCEITEGPSPDSPRRGLWASFTGHYHFDWLSPDIGYLKDPLHEDFVHDSVSVTFDEKPLEWYLIRELYPTALKEMPTVPMIAWNGEFPEDGGIFTVKFRHPLIRRSPGEYIYFYAMGTGKCWPPETYQKNCLAYLDMTMPRDWCVRRLWLAVRDGRPEFLPHPFAVTSEEGKTVVSMFADYQFGEFQRDVVASVKRYHVWTDCNFDGNVNVADLLMVRNNLGRQAISPDDGDTDVNEDGIVNVADLLMVRNSMGLSAETEPRPPVLRYTVGRECAGEMPDGRHHIPRVEVRGHKVYFWSEVMSNCCSEYIRMCISLKRNNRIIIRFKVKEAAPCDCICYTPAKGVAGAFDPGEYHIEFYHCNVDYNPEGTLIHEQDIVIPGTVPEE